MSSENQLAEMETLFLALADKTRLRLLNLMREDEICVCFFTEVLGESQPKISRHLAYLRNAGVVSARREGKWMNYSIEMPENPLAAQILQDTLEWLKSQTDMQADFKNLAKVCCAVDVPGNNCPCADTEDVSRTGNRRASERRIGNFSFINLCL